MAKCEFYNSGKCIRDIDEVDEWEDCDDCTGDEDDQRCCGFELPENNYRIDFTGRCVIQAANEEEALRIFQESDSSELCVEVVDSTVTKM